MKIKQSLTIIAALSTFSLVLLVAFNSAILGDEKASEPTTEALISQIQDLEKEIETLKRRIAKSESVQQAHNLGLELRIRRLENQVRTPRPTRILPPDKNQLPMRSVGEIIPLQGQNTDKLVIPARK